jgi:hypothetical protein
VVLEEQKTRRSHRSRQEGRPAKAPGVRRRTV